jgi:hypothetical protein
VPDHKYDDQRLERKAEQRQAEQGERAENQRGGMTAIGDDDVEVLSGYYPTQGMRKCADALTAASAVKAMAAIVNVILNTVFSLVYGRGEIAGCR